MKSIYYVYVERFDPINRKGVERWTLDNIKEFITWNDESETSENKGLTYQNGSCKIFITADMKDLALGNNTIDY